MRRFVAAYRATESLILSSIFLHPLHTVYVYLLRATCVCVLNFIVQNIRSETERAEVSNTNRLISAIRLLFLLFDSLQLFQCDVSFNLLLDSFSFLAFGKLFFSVLSISLSLSLLCHRNTQQ